MIIKELNLIHFGKFHHFCIELGPHMNLIFGPNEAGKSTVYAFIYAMLFGMRRARGGLRPTICTPATSHGMHREAMRGQ